MKSRERRSSSVSSSVSHEVGGVALEFLQTEYTAANQWAMHGEDLSHRIFSFYVTLVTATLGGALAIGQGLSGTFQSSMLVLGAAYIILLFAGPVFYEALVRDHIRNVGYRDRMVSIRTLLGYDPETQGQSPEAGNHPPSAGTTTELLDPYHPSAIQHTLVGLINSFLVGVSIPSVLWGLAGSGFKLTASLLAGVCAVIVSFLLHKAVARIIVRRHSGGLS